MIASRAYLDAAKAYFHFLIPEFGFSLSTETARSAVFYDLHYRSATQVISISYENLEDYFQVIVYQWVNQQLPNYDDKRRTLHLQALNQALGVIVGPADWIGNQHHFRAFKPEGTVQRQLLKSAKELRLCLTHFDQLMAFKPSFP
jgi:hypothetical protein